MSLIIDAGKHYSYIRRAEEEKAGSVNSFVTLENQILEIRESTNFTEKVSHPEKKLDVFIQMLSKRSPLKGELDELQVLSMGKLCEAILVLFIQIGDKRKLADYLKNPQTPSAFKNYIQNGTVFSKESLSDQEGQIAYEQTVITNPVALAIQMQEQNKGDPSEILLYLVDQSNYLGKLSQFKVTMQGHFDSMIQKPGRDKDIEFKSKEAVNHVYRTTIISCYQEVGETAYESRQQEILIDRKKRHSLSDHTIVARVKSYRSAEEFAQKFLKPGALRSKITKVIRKKELEGKSFTDRVGHFFRRHLKVFKQSFASKPRHIGELKSQLETRSDQRVIRVYKDSTNGFL